jgi:aspartyl-tRNA(Asn)/glutamyl-tRNA(Gln) amidotransferase subunit A
MDSNRACRFDQAVAALGALGAEVAEVDLPYADYALAAYYLILPSECSSNLAKFDGMRYGLRAGDDGRRSVSEVMSFTRGEGFGDEAKRRIMIGTMPCPAATTTPTTGRRKGLER